MAESAIQKILDVNVKSAILLTKEVAPHMPQVGRLALYRRPYGGLMHAPIKFCGGRQGSSIVYVSSFTAYNPGGAIPMYAVSKTTLLGLTKALAAELGPRRIRVNCIAPGKILLASSVE